MRSRTTGCSRPWPGSGDPLGRDDRAPAGEPGGPPGHRRDPRRERRGGRLAGPAGLAVSRPPARAGARARGRGRRRRRGLRRDRSPSAPRGPASSPTCSSTRDRHERWRRSDAARRPPRGRDAADDVQLGRPAGAGELHPGRHAAVVAAPVSRRRDGDGRRRGSARPGAPADVRRPPTDRARGRASTATVDFAHYARLPQASGFAVVDDGDVGRRRLGSPGHADAGALPRARLDRAGRGPGPGRARPPGSRRHPMAARSAGCVPGPHPVVPALLERGVRIVDRDQWCASDPDLVDPVRLLPNPSFL